MEVLYRLQKQIFFISIYICICTKINIYLYYRSHHDQSDCNETCYGHAQKGLCKPSAPENSYGNVVKRMRVVLLVQ